MRRSAIKQKVLYRGVYPHTFRRIVLHRTRDVPQNEQTAGYSNGIVPARKGQNDAMRRKVWGFTLIELIVTVSIFLVVSSIVLVSYPDFSQRMALNRTAQEVALTFRKAQSFALAVRGFGSQFPGYGVRFDLADSDRAFILFADFPTGTEDFLGDQRYGGPDSGEKVEEFRIQTAAKITRLCKNKQPDGVSWENCELSNVEAVYTRPDPIIALRADGDAQGVSNLGIEISSLRGVTKTIVVWITGQVTIE